MNKSFCTIEHHCLDLGYGHLRVHQVKDLERLTTSIDQYGQLVPIIVVPKAEHQWTLVDGYLRIKALKRLAKDTAEAEVWECSIEEALVMVLKNGFCPARKSLEEALLLQELHQQCGMTQQDLANRIGHDQSWISRRLSLVEHLPDSVLKGLLEGSLSLWVGSRILAPMARAIPEHADLLLPYLLAHGHSTREMQVFYDHYQRSSHEARDKMVEHPELFFKARGVYDEEKKTKALKEGLVGEWREKCHLLVNLLRELKTLAASIEKDSLPLFNQAVLPFNELTKVIGP